MRTLLLLSLFPLLTQAASSEYGSLSRCNYAIPGYALERYIDRQDGTVQDRVTGLLWQRCNLGTEWDSTINDCVGQPLYMSWQDALLNTVQYNETQRVIGEANDWHVPNIKELSSIVNLHCTYLAIDDETFRHPGTAYWSSTPYISRTIALDNYTNGVLSNYTDENAAWNVNFMTGREQSEEISKLLLVRLVRGVSKPVPRP